MLPALEEIAQTFQSVDQDLRLEILLDYARKLPSLPPNMEAAAAKGLNRVPECVTPVFLFLETDEDGNVRFYVKVADEAPTVQGLMSIIVHGCDGAPPDAVANLPADLLVKLGLHQVIGAQRTMGFSGIINRIRGEAAKLAAVQRES